jgi:6-phosphogluconolactonase
VHCILPTPDGRHAFAADLGTDRVEAYALDAPRGALTPDPARSASVHGGAGPRHLLFAPSGRTAYLLNELDSTLVRFDFDPDAARLTPRETLSTLPADGAQESFAADLILHPDGRLLMCTNRGHDSIALFRVEPMDGALEAIGHTSSGGHFPWNLAMNEDGRRLLVANTKAGHVAVLDVNAAESTLAPAGEPAALPSPMCVHVGG